MVQKDPGVSVRTAKENPVSLAVVVVMVVVMVLVVVAVVDRRDRRREDV